MKKMIIILSLVIVIVLCASCRGFPSFIIHNRDFVYDENRATELCEQVEKIDVKNNFSLLVTSNQNAFATKMFYVNGDVVAWFEEDEKGDKRAYIDGKFYKYDSESEKPVELKEQVAFDDCFEAAEFGYDLLTKVLSYDADCFEVEFSASMILEKNNVCFVDIVPKESNVMLSELRQELGSISSDLKVRFDYDCDKKTYSEISLSWMKGNNTYDISFIVDEIPEELNYQTEVLNS